MRVAVVGSGLMGAQIAAEFALGGHDVQVVSRDPDGARERVEQTLAGAETFGICDAAAGAAARARLATAREADAGFELAIESIPEDIELKRTVFRQLASRAPDAILATNTSSLSVSELGRGEEWATRLVGMHYWRPPLLMPLVEVVPGERTDATIADRVEELLRALGKRPVRVNREVPGFIWNRLQIALLREAVWLVDNGVADPATVDRVVSDGLARRWRRVGPFQAAALGGRDTWMQVGRNLAPELSRATDVDGLPNVGPTDEAQLAALRAEVDRRLAEDLLRDD